MKKLIAAALALCMLTTASLAVSPGDFSDMPKDWSAAALTAAVENGLLQGENGKVYGGAVLTRAQMATIINRAFGTTQMASMTEYTDVDPNAWYYAEMAKAVAMKTFQGSGNTLAPNAPITRQEVFAVLARAFVLPESDLSVLSPYQDAEDLAPWAKDAAAAMVGAGYIQGSKGKLNPGDDITRAEFAQIMYRMARYYVVKAPAEGTVFEGNVIVNTPGITLQGVTVKGDLILADGVGEGDATLDGVTVSGRLVVRGGGENSINITGSSIMNSVLLNKVFGKLRLRTTGNARIGMLTVRGYCERVLVQANIGRLMLQNAALLELQQATIEELNVGMLGSNVLVGSGTAIRRAIIQQEAGRSNFVVQGTVTDLSIFGLGSRISGSGQVRNALVKVNDVAVDTSGTRAVVDTGISGTTSRGSTIGGGTTKTTDSSSSGGSSLPPIAVSNVTFKVTVGGTEISCPCTVMSSTLDLSGADDDDVVSKGMISATTTLTGVQFDAGYDKFDLNTPYTMTQFLAGATIPDREVTVATIRTMMTNFDANKVKWEQASHQQWPNTIEVYTAEKKAIVTGKLIKSGYQPMHYSLILKW